MLHCLRLLLAQNAPTPATMPQLGGDYWVGTEVREGEVWGVADLHAHFFNYLGFGGRVLHGTPWAPNGMREGLHSCRVNHGRDSWGQSTPAPPHLHHMASSPPT